MPTMPILSLDLSHLLLACAGSVVAWLLYTKWPPGAVKAPASSQPANPSPVSGAPGLPALTGLPPVLQNLLTAFQHVQILQQHQQTTSLLKGLLPGVDPNVLATASQLALHTSLAAQHPLLAEALKVAPYLLQASAPLAPIVGDLAGAPPVPEAQVVPLPEAKK